MPIGLCFIKKKVVKSQSDKIVADWGKRIGVDKKDICLNIITDFIQIGQAYSTMVYLMLPSLWTTDEVDRIQLGLAKTLSASTKNKRGGNLHHYYIDPVRACC